ncbi:MAG: acyl-[acyl-carrier-protein] thioesterase [Oscillospiraceae bacterium]
MPLSYEAPFTVFQFECDPWDRMSPGAVLRRVQEVSTDQCETLGINEALYQRTHTVFLLNKISLEISRLPRIREAVTLATHAYGMKRAVYHRTTALHAQNGEKLCEADSRWLLVDTESRRILRNPIPEFAATFTDEPGEGAHAMEMPKPGEMEPCQKLRAGYLMCDRNGHVNNAWYADLICDNLPLKTLKSRVPRKMVLSYRIEIAMGDSFEFSRCTMENDSYYFRASVEGRKNFEGFVWF